MNELCEFLGLVRSEDLAGVVAVQVIAGEVDMRDLEGSFFWRQVEGELFNLIGRIDQNLNLILVPSEKEIDAAKEDLSFLRRCIQIGHYDLYQKNSSKKFSRHVRGLYFDVILNCFNWEKKQFRSRKIRTRAGCKFIK